MPSERKDLEKAAIMMRSIKNPVNKVAQDVVKAVKGVTKVKVANSLRSAFAPNTTVKRDYADPTRVNLGDKSKLGDKKTVQKLDKDGTVLKTKTKQVVSKKSDDWTSGKISINKSKKSRFADEGIEGFSNKRTRYRSTINKESKDLLRNVGGMIGGFALGVKGLDSIRKYQSSRARSTKNRYKI